MISKTIEDALNLQLAHEARSYFLYLSMAAWCGRSSMEACSRFLLLQSEEERQHMMRLYNFLGEVDAAPVIPAIEKQQSEWSNVDDLMEQVYEHEQEITKSIHDIADLCYEERDYSTLQFIQWYIAEQIEEENMMRTILDRLQLIGEGPHRLYLIDQAMSEFVSQRPDNPDQGNA